MERSSEVRYTGLRIRGICRIRRFDPGGKVTTLRLEPSLKLRNHSPTGFEWGYGGSGPAQTALALLLDWTRDSDVASQLHQDFKFLIVGHFKHEGWHLTGQQISEAITHIRAERMKRRNAQ
jgi:Family of unknown function (DUF6166)